MTRRLSIDQLIQINRELEDCPHQVTGRSELESALEAPFGTFDGVDLHQSIISKAAALLEYLAKAHGFFEGNKRTAWYAFVVFLDLNGIILCEKVAGYQDDMVVDLVVGRIMREDVALWVEENLMGV